MLAYTYRPECSFKSGRYNKTCQESNPEHKLMLTKLGHPVCNDMLPPAGVYPVVFASRSQDPSYGSRPSVPPSPVRGPLPQTARRPLPHQQPVWVSHFHTPSLQQQSLFFSCPWRYSLVPTCRRSILSLPSVCKEGFRSEPKVCLSCKILNSMKVMGYTICVLPLWSEKICFLKDKSVV